MKIEVRGKTFEINLVSNYCHRAYDEIVMWSAELSALNVSVNEKRIAYMEALNNKDADKKELLNKYAPEFNGVAERVKVLRDELASKRNDLLRELIESNGIEYDVEWWDRRTTPDDMNEFVVKCMDKDRADNPPAKKSKKKL